MLIGLGLLVLAILFGGGSPFVVPHLKKYVKTHVVDDTSKKIILDILKDAKTKRKEVSKTNVDFLKELHKLSVSRESTQEDFDELGKRMLDFELESQEFNLSVTRESQKQITAEEWGKIQKDIAASLVKSDKKRSKHTSKLEKAFDKLVAKINKTIVDEDMRKSAVQSVETLRIINIDNYKKIQAEMLNKNSAMYKYKASESELQKLQDKFILLIKEVYKANTKTHSDLVKITTPEEWKKIN